ncbi:MAG: nuclease [Armatimonadetes bacterium]|nr:nuclease [Armatimonadota bacterium]
MERVIVLDTGPLGLISNPRQTEINRACVEWMQSQMGAGTRILLPEIAGYEVRRELLRGNKINGLARLDALAQTLEYLPITTAAMREAARLWAQTRQQGFPTADAKALDADAILAAQALTLGEPDVVVATTNIGHLSRFVRADLWENLG